MPTPNMHLLEVEEVDSGRIVQTVDIVHFFSTVGTFDGIIYGRNDGIIAKPSFRVSEEFQPKQFSLDLSNLKNLSEQYDLGPQSAVIFYCGSGAGGYRVILAQGDLLRFDNQKMNEPDLIAITLARPGVYRMTDTGSGAKGVITVSKPTADSFRAARAKGPAYVSIENGKFKPEQVESVSLQPVVFKSASATRIRISAQRFDDTDYVPGKPKPPSHVGEVHTTERGIRFRRTRQ